MDGPRGVLVDLVCASAGAWLAVHWLLACIHRSLQAVLRS